MGQASVNRLPASVKGHGHGTPGVGIGDRAIGGQLILFGTIVIDGVEVTVTCPFSGGALRAAWLNGYAAAGNGEVCEAGFFARREDWEKAFVYGYETALRIIRPAAIQSPLSRAGKLDDSCSAASAAEISENEGGNYENCD